MGGHFFQEFVMTKPLKAPTTYKEQLDKLVSRGCSVEDEAFCLKRLSEINYYRLSAYFLPFRNDEGSYIPGTSFSQIIRLYEFDSALRGLLFSVIEEIEVFLKTRFSYFHAHNYGPQKL